MRIVDNDTVSYTDASNAVEVYMNTDGDVKFVFVNETFAGDAGITKVEQTGPRVMVSYGESVRVVLTQEIVEAAARFYGLLK